MTLAPGDTFSFEERSHWSFQPIRRPRVPAVKNRPLVRSPIDAFILSKLEAKGVGFGPLAGEITLVRRLYFDLIGLPPSPKDIEDFVRDLSPHAYERLVDRLLASPHYGERWGRHWLDVAGYADSEGYTERDVEANGRTSTAITSSARSMATNRGTASSWSSWRGTNC